MNNQTVTVPYVHTFEPNITELITKEQVEQFYKKNSDLSDVIYPNVFQRVTDEERLIYSYVQRSFNTLLRSVDMFGYNEGVHTFQLKPPCNIGTFMMYGDDIESLKHECYHFEENKRNEWEQKVMSLESFYTQFMTDWIEGKDQTSMLFEF